MTHAVSVEQCQFSVGLGGWLSTGIAGKKEAGIRFKVSNEKWFTELGDHCFTIQTLKGLVKDTGHAVYSAEFCWETWNS